MARLGLMVHHELWGATSRWQTDAEGRVQLVELPSGEHTVWVEDREDEPALGSWILRPDQALDVGDVVVP